MDDQQETMLETEEKDYYEMENRYEPNITYQIQANHYKNQRSNYRSQFNQFEQNVSNTNKQMSNDDEVKNVDTLAATNVETEKEDEMQISKSINTARLKYKNAQTIIQKQFKDIIQKQELEKTTILLSTQENDLILREINEQQKIREIIQLDYEKSCIQVTQSKDEITRIQQAVANAGEIEEQLNEHFNALTDKSKLIQESHQEMFNSFFNQQRKFRNPIKTKILHLEELQKKITESRKMGDSSDDYKKNVNLNLKQTISDKIDKVYKLKKHFENTKKNVDNKEEKEILQKVLPNKKENVDGLNNTINILAVNNTNKFTDMNDKVEKIIQRNKKLEENIMENSKIKDCNTKEDDLKKLEKHQQINNQIEEHVLKLKKEITEREKRVSEKSEEFSAKNIIWQANSEDFDKNWNDANKEHDIRVKELDDHLKQYVEINEEKNKLIQTKNNLEAEKSKTNADAKLIDFNITTIETEIKHKEIDLSRIQDNPIFTERKKKKAFLVACKECLSEKTENVEKENRDEKKCLENSTEIQNSLTKSIESKKVNNTDSAVPKGILKRDAHSLLPVSPKRVQFLNHSSYESTTVTSDDIDEAPNFEKMLEKFRKSKQEPFQQVKKRKLILD